MHGGNLRTEGHITIYSNGDEPCHALWFYIMQDGTVGEWSTLVMMWSVRRGFAGSLYPISSTPELNNSVDAGWFIVAGES